MACKCISDVNKRVSEHLKVEGLISNVELLSMRTFSPFKWTVGKKKHETSVIHTFCPFCGTKYLEDKKEDDCALTKK